MKVIDSETFSNSTDFTLVAMVDIFLLVVVIKSTYYTTRISRAGAMMMGLPTGFAIVLGKNHFALLIDARCGEILNRVTFHARYLFRSIAIKRMIFRLIMAKSTGVPFPAAL